MPPSTLHDPEPERRRARRTFAVANMSDTKWRKLIAAIARSHPDVDTMRIQFIDLGEVRTMRFPPSLRCPWAYMDTIEFGPVELCSIEWLEVQADVTQLADALGRFPVERTAQGTLVRGYDARLT